MNATFTNSQMKATVQFRYFDAENTRVTNSVGEDFVITTKEAIDRIDCLVENGWEQIN